jgi:hypothetical protein
MTMTVKQIYEAIRTLPVPERLRLVELVVHDVAEEAGEGRATTEQGKLDGLFADEPELIDQVCETALREREVRRLRVANG